MNCRRIIKTFIFIFAFILISLVSSTKTLASDYQYKVLDPRYNPQAQQLLDGKLDGYENYRVSTTKSFNLGTFFALFTLVVFPIGIVSLAIRTFRKVTKDGFVDNSQVIGNIKIETNANDVSSLVSSSTCSKINANTVVSNVNNKPKSSIKNTVQEDVVDRKIPENTNKSINNYFSSPISKIPNPMLLNTSPLTSNKGLCVVEYNKKYSLIGYINDEIFLLDQFDNLKSTEIRSRLSETKDKTDRYIVRLGEYKALVEVKENDMKLLLEL